MTEQIDEIATAQSLDGPWNIIDYREGKHALLGIPKSITLCGLDIEIELREGFCEETGMLGLADYKNIKIIIDPSVCPPQAVQQCLAHEICHFILWIMGEEDLRNNEKFVDMFGHLLFQAIKSGGYKL